MTATAETVLRYWNSLENRLAVSLHTDMPGTLLHVELKCQRAVEWNKVCDHTYLASWILHHYRVKIGNRFRTMHFRRAPLTFYKTSRVYQKRCTLEITASRSDEVWLCIFQIIIANLLFCVTAQFRILYAVVFKQHKRIGKLYTKLKIKFLVEIQNGVNLI